MSIHVDDQDVLAAIAYLRAFHDRDEEGIQGFETIDPRQLNLVLAGLCLANVVSAPCPRPELWLDNLTLAIRRRSGTDADGVNE